jgi:transposase
MPNSDLTRFILLPKLKLISFKQLRNRKIVFYCESTTCLSYCPHCGLETKLVHDRRWVTIKDAPHGMRHKILKIKKKRFRCTGLGCKKVHTETLLGINKGARITERLQRHILYTCHNFANLKGVCKHVRLGSKTVYTRNYNQLELEWKKRKNDPWPKSIGIDEHSFIRNKKYKYREFATLVVDHTNKRAKEIIPGRNTVLLKQTLAYIPGRDRVKNITMDLSTTYRSFARDFFPNAKIIADKFHVLRLLNPSLNKYRNKAVEKNKKLKLRKYLLMNSNKLDYWARREFQRELEKYPELNQIYLAKEGLHKLYRCKGRRWASRVLTKLTDTLAVSKIKELKSLRKTLLSWRDEILNYFENRLTNARTEGFNNVCKQLQKRAYGFKNFYNYRLRVLYACQ